MLYAALLHGSQPKRSKKINGIHVYRCLTLYSVSSRGIMGSMLPKVPADLVSHKASTLCWFQGMYCEARAYSKVRSLIVKSVLLLFVWFMMWVKYLHVCTKASQRKCAHDWSVTCESGNDVKQRKHKRKHASQRCMCLKLRVTLNIVNSCELWISCGARKCSDQEETSAHWSAVLLCCCNAVTQGLHSKMELSACLLLFGYMSQKWLKLFWYCCNYFH